MRFLLHLFHHPLHHPGKLAYLPRACEHSGWRSGEGGLWAEHVRRSFPSTMPGGSSGAGVRDLLCPPTPSPCTLQGHRDPWILEGHCMPWWVDGLWMGQAVGATWSRAGIVKTPSPLVHPSFCSPSDVQLGPDDKSLYSFLVAHRWASVVLVLLCR